MTVAEARREYRGEAPREVTLGGRRVPVKRRGRGPRTRERSDEKLVLVKARDYLFVTDHAKYVEAEIWRRYTDKAEIQMIAAAEQMALFGRQLPALKRRAVPALNKATKQAADKAMAAYTLRAQENDEEE